MIAPTRTMHEARMPGGHLRVVIWRVLTSFWFVPLAMGLAGIAIAFLAIEAQDVLARIGAPGLLAAEIDKSTGRAVLGTIATATISAASVVYSLSLVIRVLAASSLGPRLVHSFRRNHVTRVALGAQLAVFVYALVVLFQVGLVETLHTLEVLIAVVGVVIAMALLVVFVNEIAGQVAVDQIVGRIAGHLEEMIEERLSAGHDPPPAELVVDGPVITAHRDGYVQVLEHQSIARAAGLAGRTVQLLVRPGDFVVYHQPLARLDDGPLAKADVDSIRQAIGLGLERTVEQDPIQSFNLLLEVALRALSPSINDVFTGIACMHHLAGAFARLDGSGLADPVLEGEGGARVLPRGVPFKEIVERVLDPLRNAAAPIPMMSIAILRSLEALVATSANDEVRALYRSHADNMLADALSRATQEADRRDLEFLGRRIARFAAMTPEEAHEAFIAERLG